MCKTYGSNECLKKNPQALVANCLPLMLSLLQNECKTGPTVHSPASPASIYHCAKHLSSGFKYLFCFIQVFKSMKSRSCQAKNKQVLNNSIPFWNVHPEKCLGVTEVKLPVHACLLLSKRKSNTHPSVVMVTIVYQKEAGILVNLLAEDPFSA